jgi:hypothetical protein
MISGRGCWLDLCQRLPLLCFVGHHLALLVQEASLCRSLRRLIQRNLITKINYTYFLADRNSARADSWLRKVPEGTTTIDQAETGAWSGFRRGVSGSPSS